MNRRLSAIAIAALGAIIIICAAAGLLCDPQLAHQREEVIDIAAEARRRGPSWPARTEDAELGVVVISLSEKNLFECLGCCCYELPRPIQRVR